MFFVLSKVLDVLLSPLSWALALVLASVLVERRKLSRALALGAVFVLYSLSTGCVSNALQRTLETPPLRTARDGVTYDVAIVLGGLVDDEATAAWGEPAYNNNVERLLVAYDLLRTGRVRYAILSGGVGHLGAGVPEGDVLAAQLVRWGIAPERLLSEPRSRNTHENAVESKKLVDERGFRDVLLITSAFHMPRARGCFTRVGLAVDALPVDFRSSGVHADASLLLPRAADFHTSAHAVHELAGRVIYRLRGYTP